ncbi:MULTISPECIES: ArdC family protein [Thiomonas]|uniref:DUF1738 domain-containing protein n=2 Tax=Thiomonas TaxID=32012 RepID=A0A8I1SVS3_THIA3|nr:MULTISPECIES: zincin-like metallopeptidase domain-containing protein [Thiomonas]CQR44775.1 conserved hypothetical protein [Thiomonas sp. CB3]MBN8744622.1 DUF1738 domain-containing protein [Thiomonas arsenitoxydans]CDW92547.1 conserved hypothetical protein [Thiomonas sp. CB2]VDY05757.1 conserved protein of unknown function [Thiomonas sp. Bio17B3]VDY10944.1 conserved protein of unknown function [Thiomonas sp. Sup16B3]
MAETKPDQAKPPRDLRQELTNKLVQTLEQGQIPWNKPWAALRTGLPRNMETGREYRGGNRLMLMLEQVDRGYADPLYGTVKQINALGGRVKKGEHGLPVELWKEQPFYQRKDISFTLNGMRVKVFGEKNGRAEVGMPTEKEATLHVKTADLRVQRHTDQGPQHLSWDKARELDTWTSRVHTVFNVAQCEGLKLEALAPAPDFDPVARGESLKAAMARDGLSYGEHPEHAFYSPKRDQVVLPPRGAFNSELGNEQGAARYYGTLLHEIGHATGAAHRLNREGITGGHRFGSEGYAKEELRAEMFSLFAAAQTGIPYDPERHAAYVQDWAKALKNDKNEIFRAAAEAGKAVDYVLDKEQALQITQERQASVDAAMRAAEPSALGAGLTLINPDQIRPGIDLVDMEKNRMSRVLTVERNPAGTTTTTEQNLDTGTRRHMTYWEGDEIVATALSLKVKDPEQAINAEAQQGKTDSTKKPPTMHEALESSGWKQTPHGSYEKTFLLDKDRNKGGEFTRGQTVAEKILSVKTAPDGFVMAHGWEDIAVPVEAGLPPAQAVTELDNAAKERLMTEHGKSLGVTSIRGKGETQALPTKPPHEMTFAEFAQVATVRKLGPNHGREWEAFSDTMANGKSLGFADGPTAGGALRQVHKREVNNALYGNQLDTPEFLQKSMPSARVLDEYPDLQKKFAPVIEEHRQMLAKEDRKATEHQVMTESSPYEQAVQNFVTNGGKETDARRILDSELAGDVSAKALADALAFHCFANAVEADDLAVGILTEEQKKMLAKEDRKSSEYQMTKQAERAAGHDKPNAADPAADKSPEPPEADKPERPARPRLRQSHRKAAAMER